MARDYYDILGVPRDADAKVIKKAYRKLAKQYHPDVNKDPAAEAKFAEAQEAHDVLADEKKRKLYDRFGHAGVAGGAAGAGFEGEPFAGGRTTYSGPGGVNFSAEDFAKGVDLDSIFDFFGGGGGRPRAGRAGARRTSRGRDVQSSVTIPFSQAAHGGSVTLKTGGAGNGEQIEVKIPRGVDDGAKLRLKGKGQVGSGGGARGDLILTVKIAPHPYFRRDALDLHLDVPVSLDEAIFGATIEVPTLSGRANLKIPEGTGSGSRLRLRGAGLENAQGQKGDLYALVQVEVPRQMDAEHRTILEQLRGKLPDPRQDLGW